MLGFQKIKVVGGNAELEKISKLKCVSPDFQKDT